MGALAKFAEATVFLSGREPLRAKPEGHWSLGKMIADTLLDEDDIQHIAILIIGLPGSGKSTIVDLLVRLYNYLCYIYLLYLL